MSETFSGNEDGMSTCGKSLAGVTAAVAIGALAVAYRRASVGGVATCGESAAQAVQPTSIVSDATHKVKGEETDSEA